MTGGEVAVHQAGHTHALTTPQLEGTVTVDLDGETPVVHLPDDVGAIYHGDETVETDGGVATRTETHVQGTGVSSETGKWMSLVGGGLLASGGYLWATGDLLVALTVTVGGGILTYVGTKSFWRGGAA